MSRQGTAARQVRVGLRRGVLALCLGAIGSALLVPTALGAGGPTIAGAPPVVYGQQLFGNTATDDGGKDLSNCVDGESWWSMPVLAGDQVKIDYEGGLDEMQGWNVGTTDFNIREAETQQFRIGSNAKGEAIIKAPVAGTMPLRFVSVEGGLCEIFGGPDNFEPGPYDFIATVQHALAAALTLTTSVYTNSVVIGTASLADGTPLPDGIGFDLLAKWHDGSAAYSVGTVGGALSFQLALPPETVGKPLRLVISRNEDASYQAVKSVPLKVKVAEAPHKPRQPRRLHCRRGFKKRKVHGKQRCVRVKRHHKHRGHKHHHGHHRH